MSQSIIDAAKAIIPRLPELLGEQAESVKQQLQVLLDKQTNEEQSESEIIDLLGKHEATRTWMNAQLQAGQEKTRGGTLGFSEQKLGGNPELDKIKGKKRYCCPQANCDYRWTKTVDWQTPPKCPIHNCDLIECDLSKDD